jgi:photosystem II stability/assembly factor-like uncharacterized protein
MAMVLMAASALILQSAPAARWSPINTGLPSIGVSINSLLVDPSSSSTLYALATTQNNGGGPGASIVPILFKSVDAGATWVAIGSVSGVTCLAIDPSNSSNLYAGTRQGVVKSSDGGQSWTDASNNLPNGSVTRLAIDPGTPSTLYAVVSNTPSAAGLAVANALYKTTDGGANWNPLNTGLPPNAYITLIVLAPGAPSTIYILTPALNPSTPNLGQVGGLVKSSDGGQTWTPLNSTLLSTVRVSSLAADQNAPNTLYIGDNQGMQKSTDGGQTWNPLNLGPAPISSVDVIAAAPSAIYAAGRIFLPTGLVESLLKSTDGGTTWNPVNINPPVSNITAIAPDPHDPAHLSIGAAPVPPPGVGIPIGLLSTTVFKTADGGQTWNSVNAGLGALDIRAVAVDPVNENAVYAGGSGGVSGSTDGGVTWSSTALSAYTTLVIADPSAPGSLYALTGTSNGCNSDNALLFATTDAGAHWSSAVSPLNTGCILDATFTGVRTSIAITPTDSNTLYLAESNSMDGFSAILKTTNGAADWTILWDWFSGLTAPVLALAVDPTQSAGVYAGMDDTTSSGGLFKSADGGATWTNTGMTSSAVTLLAIDPGNPHVIYAAEEGHSTTPAGFQGIFKSTDAGQTWAASSAGLSALIGARSNTATALLIDPADTQVLYLGTSASGVYQSNDGGATWISINGGLTSLEIRSLTIANGPSHAVYAATSGGAFKYAGSAVSATLNATSIGGRGMLGGIKAGEGGGDRLE